MEYDLVGFVMDALDDDEYAQVIEALENSAESSVRTEDTPWHCKQPWESKRFGPTTGGWCATDC